MQENFLVSVIVPIYNTAAYLPRCIESIINQTYKNLEIILVDNAATKECLSICEKYAKQDSRIKIVHLSQNVGPTGARAAGISAANGNWIGFCDSDDWLELTAINTLLQLHLQTGAEIVWGQIVYQREKSQTVEKVFPTEMQAKHSLEDYLCLRRPYCWDKLYARQLFNRGLQFDISLSLGEDIDFVFHAGKLANFFAFTPNHVYNYFLHNISTSHTPNITRSHDAVLAWQKIEQYCQKENLHKALPSVRSELTGLQCVLLFTSLLYGSNDGHQLLFEQTIQTLRNKKKIILSHPHMRLGSRILVLAILTCPFLFKRIIHISQIRSFLHHQYIKRLHHVQ